MPYYQYYLLENFAKNYETSYWIKVAKITAKKIESYPIQTNKQLPKPRNQFDEFCDDFW